MRRPSPTDVPVVLTIAGSDSGGGAGIQADIKAIEAAGGFAASAVTALTAQNTTGVEDVEVVDPEFVKQQIDTVATDLKIDVIKTGMLATEAIIDTVIEAVDAYEVPVVVDPVMVAASGDRLLDRDAEAAYDHLIQRASVVTPNADEAAVLTATSIDDEPAAIEAGTTLCDRGAKAALIKGGHWGEGRIKDVLVTQDDITKITHDRIDTAATHGSGCTLASSIATRLAHGDTIPTAVRQAIDSIARSIRYHHDVGNGPGAVHHLASIRNEAAVTSTIDAVRSIVNRLVGGEIESIIPEVGMNVVVATPYAETTEEIAAVDGRLVRGADGLRPPGAIRLGASGHVARYLLAVREFDPSRTCGANCRFDDNVEVALEALDWSTLEIDRADQPPQVAASDGSTMGWVAETAYGGETAGPTAVYDRGAIGKEPMMRIVEGSADRLSDRLLELAEAIE